MYNIENKKIAVSLIMIAVFGIIISVFLREEIYIPTTSRVTMGMYDNVPSDYKFIKHIKASDVYQPDKALYEYHSYYTIIGVSFFGLEVKFKTIITAFIIVLGVSIYLLLYKDDEKIKSYFSSLKTRFNSRYKIDKVKVPIFLIVFILITITLFWLAINYYSALQALKRPLTWGESTFIGFSKTFLIVAVITMLIGLIKNLINKQTHKNENN